MTVIKSVSGVRGIVFDDDSKGLSSVEIIHCINQLLCWIFIVSLHARNVLILSGADDTLRLSLVFCMVLPLGARYSVDSMMNSLPVPSLDDSPSPKDVKRKKRIGIEYE